MLIQHFFSCIGVTGREIICVYNHFTFLSTFILTVLLSHALDEFPELSSFAIRLPGCAILGGISGVFTFGETNVKKSFEIHLHNRANVWLLCCNSIVGLILSHRKIWGTEVFRTL